MALVIIALPIFFLIFFLNWHLKRRGKKHMPEMLALPMGLFIIMCIIAYEIKAGFLEVIVIFFFGYFIGSLTEHTLTKERGEKSQE